MAGEIFGRVGTARKLMDKNLAVDRGKAHSIFELMRPHNVLMNKTLADWQRTAKSPKVFFHQSFVLHGILNTALYCNLLYFAWVDERVQ